MNVVLVFIFKFLQFVSSILPSGGVGANTMGGKDDRRPEYDRKRGNPFFTSHPLPQQSHCRPDWSSKAGSGCQGGPSQLAPHDSAPLTLEPEPAVKKARSKDNRKRGNPYFPLPSRPEQHHGPDWSGVSSQAESGGQRGPVRNPHFCSLCNKNKPMDELDHDVCADCLKLRSLVDSLEADEKDNLKSLIPVAKSLLSMETTFRTVVMKDLLLAAVENPLVVQKMLDSNSILRETSVRQIDHQKGQHQEEEPALTPVDSLRFKSILNLVDKDQLIQAMILVPDACFSWILDNFGFGFNYLKENEEVAPKRQMRRRDGSGITDLVETHFNMQTTFTCAVCFEERDKDLAISCVRAPNTEGNDEATQPHEQHLFCRGCVSGYAENAVEQASIEQHGLGLKCIQPDCENGVLLIAHVVPLLQGRSRVQLEGKITEQALAAAAVAVERCFKCSWGGMVERNTRKFFCRKCRFKYCRTCKNEWSESHRGKKCEEVYPEYARRMVENELSLLTVGGLHHCPTCNKPIVKNGGCKKVTCCGVKHLYREPLVMTKEQCESFIQKYIDSTSDLLVIAELKKIDCDLFSSPVPREDASVVEEEDEIEWL